MVSSSRSSPTNTQQSSTQVQNLNLQDTAGITIANSEGVTITDGGSTRAALDANAQVTRDALDFTGSAVNDVLGTGLDALRIGRDGLGTGAQLAGRGLDNALEASRGALAFGETAIGANTRATLDALDFAGGTLNAGFDYGRDAMRSADNSRAAAFDFGGTALQQVARTGTESLAFGRSVLADSIDAITQGAGDIIAANQRLTADNLAGITSLGKQVTATADDRVTKVVGYALAAVALIFVVPAVFGKGART